MEKIITISINNKEYRFLESAYLQLSDYNNFLKRTIKNKDRLNDIEIQISVLLDMEIENNTSGKIITLEIMREVISVLKENQKIHYVAGNFKQKKRTKKKRKKPYSEIKRDTKNNVLGGVCAGIANRFKIDPVFVRILFAALGLIFGIFIIIYIILWIVLPESEYNFSKTIKI